MYNLYKEDIKSYQLFIHWATSLLRGMTLLYLVATRVTDRVWPDPPGAPVSGGCPGCAPWRRTGRCGRTAPWPGRLRSRGGSLVTVLSARRKCCEDTHHSEQARQSERERNRSVEVTAPSLIPCPAGRLQCVTGDTSLVKLWQHWSFIGHERVSLSVDMSPWLYESMIWPS